MKRHVRLVEENLVPDKGAETQEASDLWFEAWKAKWHCTRYREWGWEEVSHAEGVAYTEACAPGCAWWVSRAMSGPFLDGNGHEGKQQLTGQPAAWQTVPTSSQGQRRASQTRLA